MSSGKEQFEQLIEILSGTIGENIPVENDMCSLSDESGDVAINIELQEAAGQGQLLLHRPLIMLPANPEERAGRALQLLALNGHQSDMAGHWFCIDDEGQSIHLMTRLPVSGLEESQFLTHVAGFTEFGRSLRQEFQNEELNLRSEQSASFQQGIQP